MTRAQLIQQIKQKKSFLCVGLDTDIEKIPQFLLDREDPVFEFNKQIIDATSDLCIGYKPNSAFYESRGVAGWESLTKTNKYLPEATFNIIDAKRGDIGNTSEMYARAFFNPENGMDFESITVSPYLGHDAVLPYLKYDDKWVILLALTSSPGHKDFQLIEDEKGRLFEQVIARSKEWAGDDRIMFVVGATRGQLFEEVRKIAPSHFLLVPGIGAQGGSLAEVCKYGMNKDCGLIVASSRSIIYASSGTDFADRARDEAQKLQTEMAGLLEQYGVLSNA